MGSAPERTLTTTGQTTRFERACRADVPTVGSTFAHCQGGIAQGSRTARRDRVRSTRRDQRGSITAETAVAFPALVLVLVIALWGVSAAAAQVACVDAARAGARAAARGEPETEVRAAVQQAAPPNAHVNVTRDPTITTVAVTAEARPPLKRLFPALRLRAQAVTATEPEGSDTPTP